jgi:hypothetical protein
MCGRKVNNEQDARGKLADKFAQQQKRRAGGSARQAGLTPGETVAVRVRESSCSWAIPQQIPKVSRLIGLRP